MIFIIIFLIIILIIFFIFDNTMGTNYIEDKLLEAEQAFYLLQSSSSLTPSSSLPPYNSLPPSTSVPPYSSLQAPSYSSVQAPSYRSSQAPLYSSIQAPNLIKPPSYSSVQAPSYSSVQAPSYSSVQAPNLIRPPVNINDFVTTSKISSEKQAALIAGSIAFSFILEEIIEKLFAKSVTKVGSMVTTKLGAGFAKSIGTTLSKISIKAFMSAVKSASKATVTALLTAVKMGAKAFTFMSKLTIKIMAELAAKLAIKAGQVAAKMSVVGGAKAAYLALGPVGIAMLAFDLLNLIMDAADVGGYNVLDKWKIVTDAVKQQMEEISKENNIRFPLIIGPFDSLYLQPSPDSSIEAESSTEVSTEISGEEDQPFPTDTSGELSESEKGTLYVYLLTKEIKKQASSDINIKNIVIESLTNEIKNIVSNFFKYLPREQLTSDNINILIKLFFDDRNEFYNKLLSTTNNINESDIISFKIKAEDDLENKIADYVSTKTDEYTEIATTNLCTEYKGVMLDGKCTYTTKEDCNTNFGDYDIDKSWSETDKKCYSINAAISNLCEQNGIKYDKEKGICVITEEMCRMKGGDPKKLSDGTYDCRINDGQNFFEMVFGSTLVRGLKQIFDPNQYEKCRAGYLDDNAYSCRKECDDGYEFGEIKDKAGQTALEIATLGTSTAVILAAKYTCWAKPGQERKYTCDPGYDDRGLTCDAKAVTIGPGITPDIVDRCPEGKVMTAGLCYDKCKDGYKSNGATICHADDSRLSYPQPLWGCDKHYTDRGGEPTCYTVPPFDVLDAGIVPTDCPPGEEYIAGLCYKNCKDGYNSNKTSICMAGSIDDPAIVPVLRKQCQDGYLESDLVCTARAAPADAGIVPIATCKPGWRLVGALCIKEPDDTEYEIRPGDIISYWYKGNDPLSYTVEAKEAIQDNPCSDLQNAIKGVGSCTGTVPKVCSSCESKCGDLVSTTLVPKTCSNDLGTCSGWNSCASKTQNICVGGDCLPVTTGGDCKSTGCGCVRSGSSDRFCNKYGRKCCGPWYNVCSKYCNGACESYSCGEGLRRVGTGTAVTCWEDVKTTCTPIVTEPCGTRSERICTGDDCVGAIATRSLDCTGGNVLTRTATRTCPDGYEFDGVKALCYPKTCRTGYKLVGLTCWRNKPDAILIPESNKMKPEYSCNSNRDLVAGLCYLKCELNYSRQGTLCFADKISYNRDPEYNDNNELDNRCRTGYKRVSPTDITCVKDSYVRPSEGASGCPSDRDHIDALCYKKCPKDLDASGNDLETGYTRRGIECFPPRGPAYAKEKAPCREDTFVPNSGSCWRKEYDRGAGKIPYECKSNRELAAGMCYIPCDTKDTSDIKFHRLEGAPTQCVPERGLAYPKSVLSYVPHTYIKKRAVPYSTPEQYVKK